MDPLALRLPSRDPKGKHNRETVDAIEQMWDVRHARTPYNVAMVSQRAISEAIYLLA